MLKHDNINNVTLILKNDEFNQTKFLSNDVWTVEELGLKVRPGNPETKLYFHRIEQKWLKDFTKKYIFYRSNYLVFSSICNELKALKSFSYFSL